MGAADNFAEQLSSDSAVGLFPDLYSAPLDCMSVFMLIQFCYSGSVISFEVSYCDTSNDILPIMHCIGYSWSLVIPYKCLDCFF